MSTTIDAPIVPTADKKPSRHLFWPIFLASLITIHIISVVVMVVIATHDRSFALEPDWYQKGLHYEQAIQQKRENSRLGWSVRLQVGQPAAGSNQRNVSCTVLDREGKPVENAKVDLVAFAHLRASNTIFSVLLPEGGGKYLCTIACEDPGWWEFRLVISRNGETFTQTIKREI